MRLPKRILARIANPRTEAHYGFAIAFTKEETLQRLHEAELSVSKVEKYLSLVTA